MKRTASFFMIIAVMAMLLLPNFKSYGFSNEIPPQERLGQKLSNSLFDAKIEMYDNTTGTTDGKTMGDITKIFDGDYGSAWFQTSPTSLGYENWRPYFQLTFKNNKRYVITAIEIYGATDSKNFPRELMFDSNADGSKFSQQIKNITPPSAWKSYIFDINSDNSTNSFGMQMVGDITENGNNFYSLTITEMAVYGYEVKGTVLTQEILSPQFVNPANMQAVSFASGGMGILFDGSKNTVNAVLSSSSAMLKTAFAKNYIITEVRLYGGASSSGFPSSLQIMNSDNGSSFTAVYQSKNIAYQNGAAAIYILPQEITVKYLGIALSGSGNLSLSEIELFGYEKSEPSSTSRKLTASELELTTYFERAVKPNNIFTYSNAANLFNGNFVEQIMTPGVDKNDTAYNKPTINIKFKNNKKFIITKIVPYASWELGQFPDTFNISNNINEVYTPFMSAVLDRASFSWNGVSEAHEINFNNFPVSNGFVIEMRKTGNVTAYAPFTLAELEIYGYEVTDGGENPVSNDSQILNTEFTAKAVFRDYGNLSYGITIGTTEITHVSTPISNLFNNNPVADMWMQFTPITSGYEYLKPLIIMDFNGADRYVITKVEIFGRGDKVNWPSSIKVAVSETSEVFQNIFSAQNVAAPAPGQPYTIQLGTNTSYGGSMVGVEISGNAMNDISELKIYGHKDDYEVLNNIKAPVSLKSYPSMSSLSGTNLDKLHDGLYMGQMFMTSPRNLNDNSYTMLKFDFADGKKYKIDQVRLIHR